MCDTLGGVRQGSRLANSPDARSVSLASPERGVMRRSALIASTILLVFLLGLAACGGAAKSGVRGTATIGGGPVSASYPPHTWPDRALVIVHRGDAAGSVVAKVQPDTSGAFAVDLAPGTYTLVQWGPGSVPASTSVLNAPSAPVARTVTVKPGTYVVVSLEASVP